MTAEVRLTLPDDLFEAIAQRAAAIVLSELAEQRANGMIRNEYLTVVEAAEYLRCSRQRIYDLL